MLAAAISPGVVYISGIGVPTWSLKRHPSSNETDPQCSHHGFHLKLSQVKLLWQGELSIIMNSKLSLFFICSYWSCGCAFVRTYHIAEQLIARKSLPDPCAIDQGFTREALARFTSVACRSVRSVAYVCGQRNIEETTTWKESYQDAISPLPITTSYREPECRAHMLYSILLQIWCEYCRNHNLKRKQNVLLPLPLLNLFDMKTRNAGHIHFRAILLQIGVIDHVSSARLPHTYCFFGHIIFASSYILLQLNSA
jgi:hypothetical protein